MILADQLQNMQDLLAALERESDPERVMVKYMSGETVVEKKAPEFFGNIDRYAGRLTAEGLTDGHIGIIGPNCYEWLVSFGAVLRLGAVAVLMAAYESPEEISDDILRTDIRAVLYAPSVKERLEQTGWMGKIPFVPFFSEKETRRLSVKAAENRKRAEDPACIFFTSGTSGGKKAVVHSNRSLIAGQCNNVLGHQFKAQLAVLPFHHLSGFNIPFHTWCLGGTLCLAEDMRYFFHYLEAMKPDYVFAVPSIAKVLVRRLKNADDYGASLGWDLHMLNCGGAGFLPEIVETLAERKITVMNCYGASEAGGLGLTCDITPERPDTIGKASEYVDVKIVDGELLLRSETTMLSYYKDPEATEEVLRDGWYHTGDLCEQDASGYLYLKGRKNNLINLSNGERVSPEELEKKLNGLSGVAESMVSVCHDFLAAWIVPENPESEEKIRIQVDRLNENLPGHKRIARVFFRTEPFEKNALGKLVRAGGKEG